MEQPKSPAEEMQLLVAALGAGLGVWGIHNMLDGYKRDNPKLKEQGMEQLLAGARLIALTDEIPYIMASPTTT